MNYKLLMGVLLLITILCTGTAVAAEEIPPLPAQYYGTITVNDENAPEGLIITAKINSHIVGTITIREVGKFAEPGTFGTKLLVSPASADAEGQTVTFWIQNRSAKETIPFHAGDSQELTLTFSNISLPPVPEPTPGDPDIYGTITVDTVSGAPAGTTTTLNITITNVSNLDTLQMYVDTTTIADRAEITMNATGFPLGEQPEYIVGRESGNLIPEYSQFPGVFWDGDRPITGQNIILGRIDITPALENDHLPVCLILERLETDTGVEMKKHYTLINGSITTDISDQIPERIEIIGVPTGAVNIHDGIITQRLVATVYDEEGLVIPNEPVEWISSNPLVVKIDQQGTWTASAVGRSLITAAVRSNTSLTATIPITVENTVPGDTPDIPFSGDGGGTVEDPYHITDPSQLQEIMNNPDAVYTLETDIDMSNSGIWIPLGQTEETAFNGTFNGNGKTISNLTIEGDEDYTGFISYAQGATISGIHMENVIISGKDYVGGIVGYAGPETIIRDCTINKITLRPNLTSTSPPGVGPIASIITGPNIITNCTVGNITIIIPEFIIDTPSWHPAPEIPWTPGTRPHYSVGGIAGIITRPDKESGVYQTTITDCSVCNLTINAENYVGGIVGYIEGDGVYCRITECFITGTINGTGHGIGGIAGVASGVYISNCYAFVNVTGTSGIGGIVGHASNNTTVLNCYAGGTINADTGAGGIVGELHNGTLIGNIALTRTINSTDTPGKIVGISTLATLNNNYAWGSMAAVNQSFIEETTLNSINGADISGTLLWHKPTIYQSLGWNFITPWGMDSGNTNYLLPTLEKRFDKQANATYLIHPEIADTNITLLKNTVTDSTWNARTPAEIIYTLPLENISNLFVPIIFRGDNSHLLTNVTVYQISGDNQTMIASSVAENGYVTISDDITEVSLLKAVFHGKSLGDLTGDGKVTSGDAAFIAQHAAKLRQLNETQMFYADVTGDGKTTSGDAAFIAQYAAKLRNADYGNT